MDQKTLWQAYRSLPNEAQHQITDFIAFLRTKYRTLSTNEPAPTALADEPFVGIWEARTDISESTAWVRATRKQEWHDHNA
ncbi:MAG: hypothetical protein SH847_09050 [Roseiflexaceae bacterium]|nr:hypothetical protein [Roseiflexaceae bacterium]